MVGLAILHYDMKDKNPVDYVKFYGKQGASGQPDGRSLYQLTRGLDLTPFLPTVSFKAEHGDFSTLMPSVFAEVLLRVYTKQDG